MSGFVYLIEAQVGRVKIGFSRDPAARLATMSASSLCPLRLIARWPGGRDGERALHERFSDYRCHGEWFLIAGTLAAFLAESKGVGVETIPDWPADYRAAEKARMAEVSKRRSEAHRRNWACPDFRKMQAEYRARRKARGAA